jgi:frataxin-like iron-binding protein CyaY
MNFTEILAEEPVKSAWISDISYNTPNKVLTVVLSNGKTYSIDNIDEAMYTNWINSASKGQFYHEYIRNKYVLKRIK